MCNRLLDLWIASDVALALSVLATLPIIGGLLIALDLWQARREERAFNKSHGQFCSTTYCTHRYMRDHKTCVRHDEIDAYLVDQQDALTQRQRDDEWDRIMTATRHI